jgi:poly(3-hydroxybutyrate) depolymerase
LVCLLAFSGGCGDGGHDPNPEIVVEPNLTLPAAPHEFDVYRAAGADKAVVFLHGGGGTKESSAHELGLKRDPGASNYDVANRRILLDNKAIAVFPQGRAVEAAPLSFTWDNYVMDSGQNDMRFIRALAEHVVAQYDVARICIAGHSNGGIMVNRVWCEAPELFDAFVSIAGPPSERFLDAETPCFPTETKPFLAIVGSRDGVLRNEDWEARTWTINPLLTDSPAFVNPVLIGERYFLSTRVTLRCDDTVGPGDADAVTEGAVTTWSFCDDAIRLVRIESAGHTLESLEGTSGLGMLEMVFDFMKAAD